jgi:hypothetical protein
MWINFPQALRASLQTNDMIIWFVFASCCRCIRQRSRRSHERQRRDQTRVRGDQLTTAIPRFNYVTRADGSLLTPGSLPPADTQRWVIRLKADVVMAVGGGLITMEGACSRYRLTREEFLAWQNAFEQFGLRGLSTRSAREIRRMKALDRIVDRSPDAQAGE